MVDVDGITTCRVMYTCVVCLYL